jgi:hypothetical protein
MDNLKSIDHKGNDRFGRASSKTKENSDWLQRTIANKLGRNGI